jgi:hypothetical protein
MVLTGKLSKTASALLSLADDDPRSYLHPLGKLLDLLIGESDATLGPVKLPMDG